MASAPETSILEDRELLSSGVRVPAHAVYRAFPAETVVRHYGLMVRLGQAPAPELT